MRCQGRRAWQTVGMSFAANVREALEESQRLGFLGERDISEVIAHARAFVAALDGVHGTIVDLGSGGGVPGLVIAHDRPDLHVILVDRRAKRTDFLDRIVRRLHWGQRVSVMCVDAAEISGGQLVVDAVVARGFGPPMDTLTLSAGVVRHGGRIVISEPPDRDRPAQDRWGEDLLIEVGVTRTDNGRGQVSIFSRLR